MYIIIACSILIILLVLDQDIKSYIPIIGAIFYAFKILPSFNKLILSIQLFLVSKEPINILTKEFREIKHKGIILDIPKIKKDFIFKDKIIINNLSFSFDNN